MGLSLAVAASLLLGAPDAGTPGHAMTPEVSALVARVQAFYERTADFTAGFRQEYTYAAFRRTQVSTGTVTYLKPAKMRWEYRQPSARTFVLAGDRAYLLDPAAKLLTRSRLRSNQLSASVTFLWGQGKLAEEFDITRAPCAACEKPGARPTVLLELRPRVADPRFQEVLLEVDPATAQVVRSTVVDPDGSRNVISFEGLKANVGVTPDTFILQPPPGTQEQDVLTADDAPAPRPDGGAR